jgi:ABC-type glycerol-3-phosphate transport system permease component
MDNFRKNKYSFSFSIRRKLLTYIILFTGAFISLIPFIWMISTSLMTLGEALGTAFFPSSLNFQNYAEAWRRAQFSEYFINSILITLITLSGEVTFSIFAAYAFARMEFPGRDLIFSMMLSTIMIPAMVLIIPNFPHSDLAGPHWPHSLDQQLACPDDPVYGQHLFHFPVEAVFCAGTKRAV